MAHTCPVCGQTCYCNGDIDDIILDTEEAVAKCTHCSEYEDDSSQCDYCDAAVRADKAERERDEALAAVAGKDEALKKAVDVIRQWHDLPLRNTKLGTQEEMWRIYWENAPEMKPIREALESPTLGASILQRQKERDAALAQMRGAVELLAHNPREVYIGTKHYQYLSNLTPEHYEQVNAALASDSGKATLERIRNLEAKAARLDYLRPEVLWFAEQMERQLRLHDEAKGKRGWKDMTLLELSALLDDERKELSNALRYGPAENLVHEAADVANIAMMIADNARPRKAGEGK